MAEQSEAPEVTVAVMDRASLQRPTGRCSSKIAQDLFGLKTFTAHDMLSSEYSPSVNFRTTMHHLLGRIFRHAGRHAVLIGSVLLPTFALAILEMRWGWEALLLCGGATKHQVQLYLLACCLAALGAGVGMTLSTGLANLGSLKVLVYLLVGCCLVATYIYDLGLIECDGFRQKEEASVALNVIIWMSTRIVFEEVVLDSVRSLEVSVKQNFHWRSMWWLRASMMTLIIPSFGAWLVGTVSSWALNVWVQWLFVGLHVLLDMASASIAVRVYIQVHRLSVLAQRQVGAANLRTDFPLAAIVTSQSLQWVWTMLFSMVVVMVFTAVSMWRLLRAMRGVVLEQNPLYTGVLVALDIIVNSIIVLDNSGVLARSGIQSEACVNATAKRERRRAAVAQNFSSLNMADDSAWWQKVEELSKRGFTLEALLRFYHGLGNEYMLHFDPGIHTTRDVVRAAIIPKSADKQCSYAEVMMGGEPTYPMNMVTHNWGNLFRDLVAAIISNALGAGNFGPIADILEIDFDGLEGMLRDRGKLHHTYWVCAFSVSQHDSICGSNPYHDTDPVLQTLHDVCHCNKKKYLNTDGTTGLNGKSIECELNKFDDLMAFLAARDPCFAQLIAVDGNFDLFSRAWCIAEIAQAFAMGMKQHLEVISPMHLHCHESVLRRLKVEEMNATRKEDKEEILSKIANKMAFNDRLQDMLFGGEGLLAEFKSMNGNQKLAIMGVWLRWGKVCAGHESSWLRPEVAQGASSNEEVLNPSTVGRRSE